MPDKSGKLSKEEFTRFIRFVESKWGKRICSVCGHDHWVYIDQAVAPVSFAEGQFSLGGTVYPQVMVVCHNCGHTVYFNAFHTGAVHREQYLKDKRSLDDDNA